MTTCWVPGSTSQCHGHLGAGAYICGEETALLESLEGKKGQPRFKPPFPANFGLYGKPTTINNTETLASVPAIMRKGGDWFMNLGKPNNGGVKIFSVSGHVNNPGNFEVPMGIPFSELLELAGGVRDGHQLKAVIPGGSSMPVLPADVIMETDMDYDSLAKAGSALGSGAVMVMDETTCMVKALMRVSRFYYAESCGQCTPCREGTGWMYRIIKRIEEGQGRPEDLDLLLSAAGQIEGKTICAFGEAAAWPVQGFLRHFREEFEYHIEHKCCMVGDAAASKGALHECRPEIPADDAVNIEIDGQPCQARKGAMIIEVTDELGISVPRFCYHKKLSIAANCRMCMVEVEKVPKPLPACATPVTEGMKVFTQSDIATGGQKA